MSRIPEWLFVCQLPVEVTEAHAGAQLGDYVGLSLRSTFKILKQISKLPASSSPREA